MLTPAVFAISFRSLFVSPFPSLSGCLDQRGCRLVTITMSDAEP